MSTPQGNRWDFVPPYKSTPRRTRRGAVLVVVLVVVAMLALAAFTFSDLMLSERKAADLSSRQAQARASADSGVEMLKLFLAKDPEIQKEAGGWFDNEAQFRGQLVVDDATFGPSRFTIIAPAMQDGTYDGFRFGLEDESAKLNLIALAKTATGDSARQILMGLPGMTEQTADAILDWMDSDDEPREFGAEADYYSALTPGYAPKNGPLETIEELLLVRDVSPWMLLGCDTNRNFLIESSESAGAYMEDVNNSDGSMNYGWAAYLTLYSKEKNVRPDGSPRIDVNQDDAEKLYDELEEAIGKEWATFIVAYRQNDKYTGTEPGESNKSGELDLTKQPKVKLNTILDLIGVRTRVTFSGEQNATILDPPFPDTPGLMNTYLPVLMDNLTVNAKTTIPGRVNINQASRVVLAGIPGMDQETVDTILAQRQPNPVDADVDRRHETWIMAEGIVTLEQMKTLMPFVSAGGSVYRAQVVGYSDRGGPAVRIEAVIDTSESPPRMVFFRDLSHLGRGLTVETLGIGAAE